MQWFGAKNLQLQNTTAFTKLLCIVYKIFINTYLYM